MAKPKYYISCPVTVDRATLDTYRDLLNEMGAEPISWSKGTPYTHQDDVDECDGFVLVLPDNRFRISLEELPMGCKRELTRAIKAKRKLYLAYSDLSGAAIYQANIMNYGLNTAQFHGVASTEKNVKDFIIGQATHKNFMDITNETIQDFSGSGTIPTNASISTTSNCNLNGLTNTIDSNITPNLPKYPAGIPWYYPNGVSIDGAYCKSGLQIPKTKDDRYALAGEIYDRRILLLV